MGKGLDRTWSSHTKCSLHVWLGDVTSMGANLQLSHKWRAVVRWRVMRYYVKGNWHHVPVHGNSRQLFRFQSQTGGTPKSIPQMRISQHGLTVRGLDGTEDVEKMLLSGKLYCYTWMHYNGSAKSPNSIEIQEVRSSVASDPAKPCTRMPIRWSGCIWFSGCMMKWMRFSFVN